MCNIATRTQTHIHQGTHSSISGSNVRLLVWCALNCTNYMKFLMAKGIYCALLPQTAVSPLPSLFRCMAARKYLVGRTIYRKVWQLWHCRGRWIFISFLLLILTIVYYFSFQTDWWGILGIWSIFNFYAFKRYARI